MHFPSQWLGSADPWEYANDPKSEFVSKGTVFCGLGEFGLFVKMAQTSPRILH